MGRGHRNNASNAAVRALLTNVCGENYNKRDKKGKKQWEDTIKKFENRCVYCNKKFKNSELQEEHLYSMNRVDCGLHHYSNIVPACAKCNEEANQSSFDSKIKKIKQNNKLQYKRVLQHMRGYPPDKFNPSQKKRLHRLVNKLYAQVGVDIQNAEKKARLILK